MRISDWSSDVCSSDLDDRRVDRADRDAGEPVGTDAGLVQALVDAALVGAERAATLQHQCDRGIGRDLVENAAGSGGLSAHAGSVQAWRRRITGAASLPIPNPGRFPNAPGWSSPSPAFLDLTTHGR